MNEIRLFMRGRLKDPDVAERMLLELEDPESEVSKRIDLLLKHRLGKIGPNNKS